MLSIHRASTVAGPVAPTTHSVRNISLLWWLLLILGAVLTLVVALPARGAIVSGDVAIPASDGGYQPAISISDPAKVRVEGTSLEANAVATTSGVLNATLTNRGAAALPVHSTSITGTYATWFAQANNCPANLAAGASCTIGVTIKPLAAATKLAKLSMATGATNAPLSEALSGTGT